MGPTFRNGETRDATLAGPPATGGKPVINAPTAKADKTRYLLKVISFWPDATIFPTTRWMKFTSARTRKQAVGRSGPIVRR